MYSFTKPSSINRFSEKLAVIEGLRVLLSLTLYDHKRPIINMAMKVNMLLQSCKRKLLQTRRLQSEMDLRSDH